MSRVRAFRWCTDPTQLRRVHGWLTLLWLGIGVPGVLWWRDSIPFLVGVSIYANVVGHWSSWQAARTEVRQVEAEDGN